MYLSPRCMLCWASPGDHKAVRQTRELWWNEKTCAEILTPQQWSIIPVLWQEEWPMVDHPRYLKFWAKLTQFLCKPQFLNFVRGQISPLSYLQCWHRRRGYWPGRTPLCQLLKFLLNNLKYQIRLHLLSKPHYDFQFHQFALKNHILLLLLWYCV